MTPEPDKTTLEKLGLTSLTAMSGEELPRASADDAGAEPENLRDRSRGLKRRMAAGAAIVAVLAGEIAWALNRLDPLAERRSAVAAMTDADKAALSAKYERFVKLPTAEQERLRTLAAEFAAAPDQAELLQTLRSYLNWKARLAPQQSALLVGLDAEARFQRVKQSVEEQQVLSMRELGPADSRVVMAWLEEQVRTHQDKLLENLPGTVRERFESMGGRERTWALMYYVLSQPRGPGSSRFDAVTTDALTQLRDKLSPQAQARWAAAEKDPRDGDDPKQLLADWIRQSIERTVGLRGESAAKSAKIEEHELRSFFESQISEGERQRLLALPPEEMQSQLRREYLRSRGEWKEPAVGRFGPFPRPYGSGDPRRPPGFRKPGEQERTGPGGPNPPKPPPKRPEDQR